MPSNSSFSVIGSTWRYGLIGPHERSGIVRFRAAAGRLADVCCEGGRLRMKLTFVSSVGKSSENTDVVEARFVDLAPHKRIGLSIQFLSEDPQSAGTMTITWRLEPTSSGTLVAVVADCVPSGIRRAENESGIASTLANLVE